MRLGSISVSRDPALDIRVLEGLADSIRLNFNLMVQCRNEGRRWAELQHQDALAQAIVDLDTKLAEMRVNP